MERLPNSSSWAYGPKTELSRMRACVPFGCFSARLELLILGAWVSTSCHHPFPPTCRYSHRSCPAALGNHLAEENTKRLQSVASVQSRTCSPRTPSSAVVREAHNEDCC